MIEIKNVSKRFRNNVVLDNVNTCFDSGKIILLTGENGSGKTTLFKIILGLLKENNGSINYNGKTYSGLIEEPAFNSSLTGKQNLDFLLDEYDNEYLKYLLEQFKISDALNIKVGAYSLGMRQKLGLAYLFLKKSDYLFLDEPINSLDKESIKIVIDEILKRRCNNLTTVIISHQLNWIIDNADEIYKIKDKRVLKINTSEIKFVKYVFVFDNEEDASKASTILQGKTSGCKMYCEIEKENISECIRKISSFNLVEVKKEDGEY